MEGVGPTMRHIPSAAVVVQTVDGRREVPGWVPDVRNAAALVPGAAAVVATVIVYAREEHLRSDDHGDSIEMRRWKYCD